MILNDCRGIQRADEPTLAPSVGVRHEWLEYRIVVTVEFTMTYGTVDQLRHLLNTACRWHIWYLWVLLLFWLFVSCVSALSASILPHELADALTVLICHLFSHTTLVYLFTHCLQHKVIAAWHRSALAHMVKKA